MAHHLIIQKEVSYKKTNTPCRQTCNFDYTIINGRLLPVTLHSGRLTPKKINLEKISLMSIEGDIPNTTLLQKRLENRGQTWACERKRKFLFIWHYLILTKVCRSQSQILKIYNYQSSQKKIPYRTRTRDIQKRNNLTNIDLQCTCWEPTRSFLILLIIK